MATKLQFEVVADRVDIRELWRSLTSDKIKVLKKAAPGLVKEAEFLGGGAGEVGIGSVVFISFGHAVPGVEPFKERIVEFDESRHLLSFLGLEGGHLKQGFTHSVVSFKLDDAGGGKTLVTTSVTYDLEQNFDGARLLEGFLKILRQYVDGVISYMKKNKA